MMNYSKILIWYLDKYDMKVPWSQRQEDNCFCHKNWYFWFCCSFNMSQRHAGVDWTFVIWLVLYLYKTRILLYIYIYIYIYILLVLNLMVWARQLSRYSNWLWAGQSGNRIPVGRDFPPIQTGPGAHAASCTMGTGSFPGVKYGRGMLLTPRPLLAPQLWKSRAMPLPTLWATTGPVIGTLYLYIWWLLPTMYLWNEGNKWNVVICHYIIIWHCSNNNLMLAVNDMQCCFSSVAGGNIFWQARRYTVGTWWVTSSAHFMKVALNNYTAMQ